MKGTVDAFEDELPLFAYNLPACAVYFDEFVCGMSRFFQWDEEQLKTLSRLSDNNERRKIDPIRTGEAFMFVIVVLSTLDRETIVEP